MASVKFYNYASLYCMIYIIVMIFLPTLIVSIFPNMAKGENYFLGWAYLFGIIIALFLGIIFRVIAFIKKRREMREVNKINKSYF